MTDKQEKLVSFDHIDLDNKEEVISALKRSFNILQESNIVAKKNAIKGVYEFLESSKDEINTVLGELILNNFGKLLLKALSDNVEKVRELSLKSLNFLLSRCEDFSTHLPYIIAVLVERMNCDDLEGIQNLPEVMRPVPTQKPHVHVKLHEPVEEIRVEYTELLNTIISCSNEDEIRDHINDLVNILRSLSMDPCADVQIKACQVISLFCKTFKELLLHFSELLARAILLPLVNKRSKVRLAALEALGQILYCGVWKYNNNIMEILVGFRDPNVVPIRDFFEYTTKINYFAMLIKDPKTTVREFFIRCLGDWLIDLPDRYDHEPRLVPYIVSGLFDPDDEIKISTYEIIEEIGAQQEREREKDFRDIKQFGYDAEWTLRGKITDIPLPFPFKKRPRLGARHFVRSHIRKFLSALYKEVKDWQYENRLEAANLLLYGLIYAEDYITQFLNKFLVNLLHNFKVRTKDDEKIYEKLSQIFFYLGIYCSPDAYMPLLKSALKGELSDNEELPKFTLHAIHHLLRGCFEVTSKELGIDHKRSFIYFVIGLIGQDEFLSGIDKETAPVLENILETILVNMLEKAPADDLEQFYRTKKYQIEMIFYTVMGFNLMDFNSQAHKLNFEHNFKPELSKYFENNKILGCLEKLEEIFEDLMLDNFIETFTKKMKEPYLNLVEWKIIYALFMSGIYRREKSPVYYQDVLTKTLSLIKEVDITSYSKAFEVIQMNILIPKLIADTFTDEELANAQSYFLYYSVDLIRKIYNSAEKNVPKIQELRDKLLILTKNFFCRNISWLDSLHKFEDKKDFLNSYLSNIAELVTIMSNNLKKRENVQKDFKANLVNFTTILNHLGPLVAKKARLMINKENKYLVPELSEYLLFLHEKFIGIDEEEIMPVLFEALNLLLVVIPDQKDEWEGDEALIPKYKKFLDRIIVLTIDAKDQAYREKYKNILKVLCKKTPYNILREWEKALQTQSVARIDLLTSLKKDIAGYS